MEAYFPRYQLRHSCAAKLQENRHSYHLQVATILRPLTKGKTRNDQSPRRQGIIPSTKGKLRHALDRMARNTCPVLTVPALR